MNEYKPAKKEATETSQAPLNAPKSSVEFYTGVQDALELLRQIANKRSEQPGVRAVVATPVPKPTPVSKPTPVPKPAPSDNIALVKSEFTPYSDPTMIEQLQAQNAELRKQYAELILKHGETCADLAQARADNACAQRDLNETVAQLLDAEERVETTHAELVSLTAKYNADVVDATARSKDEIANLTKRLEDTDQYIAQLIHAQEAIESYSEQLETIKAEYHSEKTSNKAKFDEMVSKYNHNIVILQNDRRDMEVRLKQENQLAGASIRAVDELNTTVIDLKAKLARAEANYASLVTGYEGYRNHAEKIRSMENQVTEANVCREVAERQLSELQATHAKVMIEQSKIINAAKAAFGTK